MGGEARCGHENHDKNGGDPEWGPISAGAGPSADCSPKHVAGKAVQHVALYQTEGADGTWAGAADCRTPRTGLSLSASDHVGMAVPERDCVRLDFFSTLTLAAN